MTARTSHGESTGLCWQGCVGRGCAKSRFGSCTRKDATPTAVWGEDPAKKQKKRGRQKKKRKKENGRAQKNHLVGRKGRDREGGVGVGVEAPVADLNDTRTGGRDKAARPSRAVRQPGGRRLWSLFLSWTKHPTAGTFGEERRAS